MWKDIIKLPYLLRESTSHATSLFAIAAYLTLTASTQLSDFSCFDTDSSFWVWDNSATGHICKDKSLFSGELVPSIFKVGSATGILTPTLMGRVILRLMDDEGVTHSFELTNVNYLPDSPVNLLSLWRLAEMYLDVSGHPDWYGTGIQSGFDNHVLFWIQEHFKKSFTTASSGLPECLFNSDYSQLQAFSTTISKFYDDKICWALASKKKVYESADLDDNGAVILTIGEDDVTLDIPIMLTLLVSFFKDMKLKYNDGQGTRNIVTFLGADFGKNMQI